MKISYTATNGVKYEIRSRSLTNQWSNPESKNWVLDWIVPSYGGENYHWTLGGFDSIADAKATADVHCIFAKGHES